MGAKRVKIVLLIFMVLLSWILETKAQHHLILGVIKKELPNAIKVERKTNIWYSVYDTNNKLIAYALTSYPYSSQIVGFMGNTPIIIILELDWTIRKIELLNNNETEVYTKKLKYYNFFESWNNINIRDIDTVYVDAYTGATITANAIKKNLMITKKNALKKPHKN